MTGQDLNTQKGLEPEGPAWFGETKIEGCVGVGVVVHVCFFYTEKNTRRLLDFISGCIIIAYIVGLIFDMFVFSLIY